METGRGPYSTKHSDIWSLGIILINMISGRNPWRSAVTSDKCFAQYLHNPGFFREMLPISEGACDILKRIFNLNPLSRISLQQLRKEILEIDTFFMSPEDLANSSEFVRAAAGILPASFPSAELGGPPRILVNDATIFDDELDYSSSEGPLDSEEVYEYESPDENGPIPSPSRTRSLLGQDSILDPFSARSLYTMGSISLASVDSTGPITPETYAVDPNIEVPDLPEGENLDESVVCHPVQQYEAPHTYVKSIVQRFETLLLSTM
jgi:serine/threonine protein kinase